MQSIILIGRANVGKSSLFNAIARRKIAITSEISGTTRDINKTQVCINSKKALLIDSGGLSEGNELFENVKKNTLKIAKESSIILYLVDAKLAPDDRDRYFFYSLKKLRKPIALVINKVDSKKDEQRSWEFANFGIKEVFNLSVIHNIGFNKLYNWLEKFLDEDLDQLHNEDILEHDTRVFRQIDQKHIRVGIVGRVNVGKSSLLNALVKQERSVVSSVAGTTIDPVNESIVHKDKIIEFIDTAGIKKRGKTQELEYYALRRTQKILSHSQIALLILDAHEGFNELDERIAGLVAKYYLGVIIVLNKWDKTEFEFDRVVKHLRLDRFKFLAYAPIISVCALSGRRIHLLLEKILEVFKNFTQKIPTSQLNDLITDAIKTHPLPHDCGKLVKIYYGVQYDIAPPKIALVMNRPKALHFSYKRYLQNQLRKEFNLEGVPLILASRKKTSKEDYEG